MKCVTMKEYVETKWANKKNKLVSEPRKQSNTKAVTLRWHFFFQISSETASEIEVDILRFALSLLCFNFIAAVHQVLTVSYFLLR